MKKLLFITLVALAISMSANAQRIYCSGTKLMMNGNPIYMNGTNTPWDNWNDFGGNYDGTFWEAEFARFETYGINSTRIWISCNGDVQPNINTDGTVTGVSQQFWDNVDDMLTKAKNHKIYVMATMISFDHTKNSYVKYQSWRNMLADQDKVQSFIDNYLVPFVVRYKNNPYLYNIDLCNEMEWMNQNAEEGNIPWTQLQRYAAMCSAAIHKSGSEVTVSLGSAAVKWGSDLYDGNKWSNTALQAQYNDSKAYLDIYQIHYYDWINQYFSNPFTKSPANYSINDRPVVIGEMPGRETLMGITITMAQCFENAYNLGYCGHYPWTSNNAGSGDFGSLSTFGSASTSFKNNHTALVYPPVLSCSTPNLGSDFSTCGLTLPVQLNSNSSTGNLISFKWYKDNVLQNNATSSTYSVNAAGTYKVVRDSSTCSHEDEVIVSSVLSVPALGTDVSLCNPATVTLDAGISGNAITYIWKKDGKTIANASSKTLAVSSPGTYAVTLSASGCASQSDEVVVTSQLLTVTDDTICSVGKVQLNVSGGTGTYNWYTSSTSITSLYTGIIYDPTITTNSTYYVEDAGGVTSTFGKPTMDGAAIWNLGTADFATNDKQSKLTVLNSCTLTKFALYVVNAGTNVTVRIMNGTTVVATKTLSNVAAGKQYIQLDFNLASGVYQIDLVGTNNTLQYQSDGAVFPYEVANYIKIENTDSWAATRYGFFFDLEIKVGNTCERTPVKAIIDNTLQSCTTTSIDEEQKSGFRVYPNPAVNQVSVVRYQVSENSNTVIQITNTLGQTVFTGHWSLTTDHYQIDLSQFEPGLYFIKVGDYIQKFIKN